MQLIFILLAIALVTGTIQPTSRKLQPGNSNDPFYNEVGVPEPMVAVPGAWAIAERKNYQGAEAPRFAVLLDTGVVHLFNTYGSRAISWNPAKQLWSASVAPLANRAEIVQRPALAGAFKVSQNNIALCYTEPGKPLEVALFDTQRKAITTTQAFGDPIQLWPIYGQQYPLGGFAEITTGALSGTFAILRDKEGTTINFYEKQSGAVQGKITQDKPIRFFVPAFGSNLALAMTDGSVELWSLLSLTRPPEKIRTYRYKPGTSIHALCPTSNGDLVAAVQIGTARELICWKAAAPEAPEVIAQGEALQPSLQIVGFQELPDHNIASYTRPLTAPNQTTTISVWNPFTKQRTATLAEPLTQQVFGILPIGDKLLALYTEQTIVWGPRMVPLSQTMGATTATALPPVPARQNTPKPS